jgi:predicted Zn-ribbon and HTH transcriptional regulator
MGHFWWCDDCGHSWVHYDEQHRPQPCPKCKSTNVQEGM